MRLFTIRRAPIDQELRETYEQYGVVIIQILLHLATIFVTKVSLYWLETPKNRCCHG